MKNLIFSALVLLSIPVVSFSSLYKGIDLRNGKTRYIQTDKNKPLVALFLSSNCPCSQASFDYLNNLQKKYPNYQFIGFNSNKRTGKKAAMRYFKKFDIDFPILLDKKLTYANKFQALKTPHTFIKMKGDIVYQGGVTDRRNPEKASSFYLDDALSAIKNNTTIQITESKTLGCFIRR